MGANVIMSGHTVVLNNTKGGAMPKRIRFELREGELSATCSAQYSILIGRQSRHKPVDIDLAPYGGVKYGVSRQHVEILPKPDDDKILVKDLGTVNGTSLNQQRLIPGHYYQLQDGDELKVGMMHLTVQFIG